MQFLSCIYGSKGSFDTVPLKLLVCFAKLCEKVFFFFLFRVNFSFTASDFVGGKLVILTYCKFFFNPHVILVNCVCVCVYVYKPRTKPYRASWITDHKLFSGMAELHSEERWPCLHWAHQRRKVMYLITAIHKIKITLSGRRLFSPLLSVSLFCICFLSCKLKW